MSILKQTLRIGLSQVMKVSPMMASKILYYKTFKRPLNLNDPQTFNEKIMWLKLFETSELKKECTDKYLAREYVHALNLSDHLIPLYQVASQAAEISFDQLPNRFVLKCTHGSGFNLICQNKRQLDKTATMKQLMEWMNTDFPLANCEPHYTKIKPRILAEHFIGAENGRVPMDYKIHCFHGEPQVIGLATDRFTAKQICLVTPEWEPLSYVKNEIPSVEPPLEKPQQLDAMLAMARKLSKAFTYVRVDLYCIEDKIYFGELTFTPEASMAVNLSEFADIELGKLLHLPGNISNQKNYTQALKTLLIKK